MSASSLQQTWLTGLVTSWASKICRAVLGPTCAIRHWSSSGHFKALASLQNACRGMPHEDRAEDTH